MIEDNTFATIDEFQTFWRTLNDAAEYDRAVALLNYASNYLKQIYQNNNIDLTAKLIQDETGVLRQSLKFVVMSAVKRMIAAPVDAPNAEQWSLSASPYSETIKYAAPANDLFFKTNELQMLGLRSINGNSSIGILRGVRGVLDDQLDCY